MKLIEFLKIAGQTIVCAVAALRSPKETKVKSERETLIERRTELRKELAEIESKLHPKGRTMPRNPPATKVGNPDKAHEICKAVANRLVDNKKTTYADAMSLASAEYIFARNGVSAERLYEICLNRLKDE